MEITSFDEQTRQDLLNKLQAYVAENDLFKDALTFKIIKDNSVQITLNDTACRLLYLQEIFAREGFNAQITIAKKISWRYRPTLQQMLQRFNISEASYQQNEPLMKILDPDYATKIIQPIEIKIYAYAFSTAHKLTLTSSIWAILGIIFVLQKYTLDLNSCKPGSVVCEKLATLRETHDRDYFQKDFAAAQERIAEIAQEYQLTDKETRELWI